MNEEKWVKCQRCNHKFKSDKPRKFCSKHCYYKFLRNEQIEETSIWEVLRLIFSMIFIFGCLVCVVIVLMVGLSKGINYIGDF